MGEEQRDRWVSPAQAVRYAAAAADELVPLGDERLDEMLAGGFRGGELCGLFGDLLEVRRTLWHLVRNCVTMTGPVLHFALTTAAAEARTAIAAPLGGMVLTPPVRGHTVADLLDRAEQHARDEICLVVVDQLDAVRPASPEAPAWEHEAQVTRDLKALARTLDLPVLVTCAPAAGADRSLPIDRMIENADILLRTSGRLTSVVKNRHGLTQLPR
jgi:hypothetical protein